MERRTRAIRTSHDPRPPLAPMFDIPNRTSLLATLNECVLPDVCQPPFSRRARTVLQLAAVRSQSCMRMPVGTWNVRIQGPSRRTGDTQLIAASPLPAILSQKHPRGRILPSMRVPTSIRRAIGSAHAQSAVGTDNDIVTGLGTMHGVLDALGRTHARARDPAVGSSPDMMMYPDIRPCDTSSL